jgi:hypothetical protein
MCRSAIAPAPTTQNPMGSGMSQIFFRKTKEVMIDAGQAALQARELPHKLN